MKTLLIFLSILLFACQQEQPLPEGILDREVFKKILTEAQLTEARMNQELVVAQRKEIPVEQYYQDLFKQFQISEDQFKRSFEFYASQPQELKVIYEEIIAELSRRKDLPPVSEQLTTGPIQP